MKRPWCEASLWSVTPSVLSVSHKPIVQLIVIVYCFSIHCAENLCVLFYLSAQRPPRTLDHVCSDSFMKAIIALRAFTLTGNMKERPLGLSHKLSEMKMTWRSPICVRVFHSAVTRLNRHTPRLGCKSAICGRSGVSLPCLSPLDLLSDHPTHSPCTLTLVHYFPGKFWFSFQKLSRFLSPCLSLSIKSCMKIVFGIKLFRHKLEEGKHPF